MFDFVINIFKAPFICIGWIIVGALAGALANQIMGRRGNPIINVFLGWIGVVVGNVVLGLFGLNSDVPNWGLGGVIASLIIGTIGAVIFIFVWRVVRGGSSSSPASS